MFSVISPEILRAPSILAQYFWHLSGKNYIALPYTPFMLHSLK
jgi:hypothetical protein